MDNLRNRMRQSRTFGYVGALGKKPPGATRSGISEFPRADQAPRRLPITGTWGWTRAAQRA